MQKITGFFLSAWILVFSCAERPAAPVIHWMTLGEAEAAFQKEKKPVYIDLYTDWCGWCKEMDKRTYSNKQVGAYLQDKFYPVKLDAETRETLSWMGKTYAFNAQARVNEFAIYITRGRLAFPTTVIIPADGEPQALPGFLKPGELELAAKYFGDGNYGKVEFQDYLKTFKADW